MSTDEARMRLAALASVAAWACLAMGCRPGLRGDRELATLAARVPAFAIVELPPTGRLELSLDQSLTVEQLRGVPLDDDPPALGERTVEYDPRMTDSFPPGQAPYVAKGIAPFRFRHFHCEFNYGGWHNWAMADSAATRGFEVLYPYNHGIEEWTHVPRGTRWLKWGGFVNWHTWLPKHNIAEGRYDELVGRDVEKLLADEQVFKPNDGFDYLMIDMEHGRLRPDKLREQAWYPAKASSDERRAFEQRYYDGYAQTYIAPVRAARRQGWRRISLYGWQPFGRAWFGLEDVTLDPATDHAWNAFGKAIYDAVDILNPTVYCFYWSPQNVAYTLANIDLNMQLVRTMPVRKPVRPYYWTLLHGGGGGHRWWKGQPIRNEDVRAMIAMGFFTGFDGFDTWNWSGTGNHHRPALSHVEPKTKERVLHDITVKDTFEATAEAAAKPTAFHRYDALHILSVDDETGRVRFQRIEKENHGAKYGCTPDKPVYAMRRDDLVPHLRAKSEPVAAMIEGMALVKPFERLLRRGEVRIDVPAQEQFAGTLPIVRRIRCGRLHILITYDPLWHEHDGPRRIVLADFDGRDGATLVLPADRQTRIFVLRDPS